MVRAKGMTSLKNERDALIKINNRFITKLIYTFQSPSSLFMALELADNGIKKNKMKEKKEREKNRKQRRRNNKERKQN